MAENREFDPQIPETLSDEKAAETGTAADTKNPPVSETWAEETIADLDDFIESQGVYIRQ